MGFILLQESHSFYLPLAGADARGCPMATGGPAPVILHFAIDAVEAMAQAIHRLSDEVEVLGPVALDHPLIRHAVAGRRPRRARAHPAFRSIGPQRSGYIGLDNHKAGRTAAVYRALMPGNGEIGIIIGDNRFTCRKAVRSAFAPACENRAGATDPSRFAVMNGRISPDRDGTDAD